MKRIWLGIAFLGAAALPLGCNKFSPPQEKPAAHPTAAHEHEHGPDHEHDKAVRVGSIEQEERAIELQAQRAKRDIDDVTAEAESALENAHKKISSKIEKRARDLSELSTEAAEDAKDRAEDVPEAIDEVDAAVNRAIHRHLQPQERQKEEEEVAAEEDPEDNR